MSETTYKRRVAQQETAPMAAADTLEKPKSTTKPDAGPRWRERLAEAQLALEDQGMHRDAAVQGAWWTIVLAMIAEGVVADAYDAEVRLAEFQIRPPRHPMQRWVRLRNGDFGSAGSRADGPPPIEKPTTRPGWTPADRAQMMMGETHKIMDLWKRCHGRAPVLIAGIAEELREALAGSRRDAWSDEDFLRFFSRQRGYQTGEGFIFDAVGFHRDRPITAFRMDYPTLYIPPPPKDEAFLPWHNRIADRILELREDPTFYAGAGLPDRLAFAQGLAVEEALTAYMEQAGVGRSAARRDMGKAGLNFGGMG